MRKSAGLLLLTSILLFTSMTAAAGPAELASQWSPVIRMDDTRDGLTAQQNIFTLVNYDGDWRLNNNWYNLLFYPLERAMYYSVVESDTHYYIGYYQYYPRHTGGSGCEHDLTGVLLAIDKTADGSDQLAMLLTYSNNKWRHWPGSRVRLEGGHPVLNIRAGSHAITAAGGSSRAWPASLYELPAASRAFNKTLPGGAHGGYRLVPLATLWERRQDIGQGRVFANWGVFDSYNEAKVAAPWVWEHRRLNWLKQPGELVQYFRGQPVQDCNYLSNPY